MTIAELTAKLRILYAIDRGLQTYVRTYTCMWPKGPAISCYRLILLRTYVHMYISINSLDTQSQVSIPYPPPHRYKHTSPHLCPPTSKCRGSSGGPQRVLGTSCSLGPPSPQAPLSTSCPYPAPPQMEGAQGEEGKTDMSLTSTALGSVNGISTSHRLVYLAWPTPPILHCHHHPSPSSSHPHSHPPTLTVTLLPSQSPSHPSLSPSHHHCPSTHSDTKLTSISHSATSTNFFVT